MAKDVSQIRNIGTFAHVDVGKTTLMERILFYTKRIKEIHEVRGGDGVGATMDFGMLERERGITIRAATTNVDWRGTELNFIDTPGHVEFTSEVEGALSVLDAGILMVDGVVGVQPGTYAVNRQMNKHKLPRIVFVNKCDKTGAKDADVLGQIRDRLNLNAAYISIPIYQSPEGLEGVIDIISMKSLCFGGTHGEVVKQQQIPDHLVHSAERVREDLLVTLCSALNSEELLDAYVAGALDDGLICSSIRRATILHGFVPVLAGAALRDIGVQPLLDAIAGFCPSPQDVVKIAYDKTGKEVRLVPDPGEERVVYSHKLFYDEEGRPLTSFRVYQGRVAKGDKLSARSGESIHLDHRMARMFAGNQERIASALPGEFFVLPIEVSPGVTFNSNGFDYAIPCTETPEPLISQSIEAKDQRETGRLANLLGKYDKQDPSFRFRIDPETHQMIIQGMGGLHLEIIVQEIEALHSIKLNLGEPEVAYKERPTKPAQFSASSSGKKLFASVEGFFDFTVAGSGYEFFDDTAGAIPSQYIKSVDSGFRLCLNEGLLIGAPIEDFRVVLESGGYHPGESSARAYKQASIKAFQNYYLDTKPEIIEPIMDVHVECPNECVGDVIDSIIQREGAVVDQAESLAGFSVQAKVPLRRMFGYVEALRKYTAGRGEFTMHPSGDYRPVPGQIAEKLIARYQLRKKH